MSSRILFRIGSLYQRNIRRRSFIPQQSRKFSCKQVSDHSRKDIPIPPPIPEKLRDLALGFRASQAFLVARCLGIFDTLDNPANPQSAEEVAAKLSTNPDATARLMDTLVALELLQKNQNGETWLYSNTQMASQFLTQSSPDSMIGFTDHTQKLVYPLFGNLATAVKEGTDQWMNTFDLSMEDMWKKFYQSDEARVRFMEAMHNTSRYTCHGVARAFDLSKFHHCCDLGGSSGTMAYTLCQYYPDMKITVCDFQSVVDSAPHFKPSLEDCPNQANVSFVVGDFFQPNLPKADLYVLSRIIHDWSDDKVDIILSNIYNCLSSGGGLLVAELTLDDDKTGPLKALLQSLLMLVLTNGKERSGKEYKELLEKHGFVDFQMKRLDSKSWMDAILCRKG